MKIAVDSAVLNAVLIGKVCPALKKYCCMSLIHIEIK